MEDKQLLTVNQVAEILNITKFTVYKMVHKGMLPAYRVGNKKIIRIKYSDIVEMLEKNKLNHNKINASLDK